MKKTTLFAFFFSCLAASTVQAQGGFIQLGTSQVEDKGHRLIATSDGGYITAGSAGPKAVLYKTDCLGQLVAKIEKTYSPGPAFFYDVTELADGSIVAVGGAGIVSLTDTGGRVIVLKTNPLLVETASSSFSILNLDAQGKSIAKTPAGHLLVYGEVAGTFPDFSDIFLQRVDPLTLQPSAVPAVGSNGVDLASRIIPTADGNYLLAGSSFVGDISDPNAPIDNFIRAYKVDEFGALIWQTSVPQTFLAKYGVAQSCGAAQSIQSGNFILGATMYGGTDVKKQDAFFALVGSDGTVLDTAYADAPGQQRMFAIAENSGFPGAFTMIGDGDGSPLGVPSIVYAQAIEAANQLFSAPAYYDVSNPLSLRDLAEVDPGRFAFMATIPDNPIVLGATDIIISTPEAVVGVVYQNCALAATLSTAAVAFQWTYEGQDIPGANQGVYFPSQPGLYEVKILDDKGCYGISDTFRVEGPVANFLAASNGLMASFTNASQGALSYAWSFGDGSTSTQVNPTHNYPGKGVYTVQLIVTNNCGLKDTVLQQVGVTPTDEASWLNHFSLSPNPTSDVFNLEMSGTPQDNVEFLLFNSVGQMLFQEVSSFQNGFLQRTFDLSPFPGDVYSLHIRTGKEAKNVRIVKR